jgi:hypothetical protein
MKRLLILTALLASAGVSTANADPGHTVDITVTAAGFQAPQGVSGGAITLRVKSTDPQGAWLGLVRLRPGVALETYVADVRQAFSDDPATSVAGGRAVTRDVEMLGGVAVAQVPASVTIIAAPGVYQLVDFRDVREPDFATRIRPLRVTPGANAEPGSASQILQLDSTFVAPRQLTAGANVRVTNLSRQLNEAMLIPVRPGTTLGDLDSFFSGAGGSPFTGGPSGVVPMSPGRSAVFSAELPVGEYALVTFVRDLRTGAMLAAEGMRALVAIVN